MTLAPGAFAGFDRELKLKLAAFVCALLWADRMIQPGERKFLTTLITQMGLLGPDAAKAQGWLVDPPPLGALDVSTIPEDKRRLFAEVAEKALVADGSVGPVEQAALQKVKQTLLGIAPPPHRR